MNPYIYDSYIIEVEKYYIKPLKQLRLIRPDLDRHKLHTEEEYRKEFLRSTNNDIMEGILKLQKERIQSNVVQSAYVILGLGNLKVDEEF